MMKNIQEYRCEGAPVCFVSSRDVRLDIYRGLAIMLVVFGHGIQDRVPDFDRNMAFKAIYMFHMPLFFYICGMVYGLKSHVLSGAEIGLSVLRRATQLLFPFIIWYLINYAMSDDTSSLTDRLAMLFRSPDYGLWFLWILFLSSVLADFGKLVHTTYKLPYGVILIVIFCLTGLVGLKTRVIGIPLLIVHLPFFFCGIFHQKLINSMGKFRYFIVGMFVVAWPFMFPVWERNRHFQVGIETLKFFSLLMPQISHAGYLLFGIFIHAVSAISGIVIFFLLSSYLLRSQANFSLKMKEALVFIGTRTLEIYTIHFFFIGVRMSSNLYLDVIFSSISAIALSITITEFLIKPIGPVNFLLMGRTK